MIQLATDPNAKRTSYRPQESADGHGTQVPQSGRSRAGHAWPFPSRYAERTPTQGQKPTASDGGS